MTSFVDYVKFAWTALLIALAAAGFIAASALRLRSAGVHPLRAVLRIRERSFFHCVFLLFLIAGVVHYAGSKESGSAPMRSAPYPSSGVASRIVPDDPAMPDFTNEVSELAFTGFRETGTSSVVRVGWPCTSFMGGGLLDLLACSDLVSNDWIRAASVEMPAAATDITVEIPHTALPGDGTRAFFTAVAKPRPEIVRPVAFVATNNVAIPTWTGTLLESTVGRGPLPNRLLLRSSGGTDNGSDGFTPPQPTFVGPFPQIAHGGADDGWDNVFHLISRGTLTVASSGNYRFFVAADDDATLTVGDLCSVSVTWETDAGRTVSICAHLEADTPYDVSVRYVNSGAWEYELVTGMESAGSSPQLVLSTNEVVFCPGPGLDLSFLAAVAHVTGQLDVSKNYAISIRLERGLVGGSETVAGKLAPRAKAWPDASYAWEDGESAAALFVLLENNEEIASDTCVFRCVKAEPDPDCGCGCGMASEFSNGCVAFSQPFGHSPLLPEVPRGRAVVSALAPGLALESPCALRFDHPAMRRIVSLCDFDADIVDGLGRETRYRGGLPSGASSGAGGQIYRDASGAVVEELPDGLRVRYAPDGTPSALAGRFGDFVPVDELGLAVTCDADGAITSIESVADGRLATEPGAAGTWRLVWSAPSGATVKAFDFVSGDNSFTAVETRDAAHSYTNRWTYDAQVGDWTLVRGADSHDGVREAKVRQYDPARRVWLVTRTVADAAGTPLSQVEETISRDGHVARVIARRDALANRTLATATLDARGEISSETDDRGATTSYAHDGYGRVTRETVTASGVPTRTVEYDYSACAFPLEFRPTAKRTFADGELLLAESFEYAANSETHTRTANGVTRAERTEYDAFGRTTLRVDESGRATATAYSAPNAEGAWTETEETGVIPDWSAIGPSLSANESCDDLLALFVGKSTREVRTLNAQGDAVRTERFALVADDAAPNGATWRALDFETHAYSASHKVVASNYSDGTSDAADWICTGPVFTRNREGLVVSNAYNAAKMLARSTRFGAFGAVTTEYDYDAAGRIVREVASAANCETQTVTHVYDSRGRIVRETDAQGRVTTSVYNDDAHTTATTYADGGTRLATYNADGSLASITGTSVTPEYHAYAVTTFGDVICRVHEIRYGRPDSPRFTRTFTDGFGDVLREERSGANGTTLITENAYDACGRLVESATTGSPSVSYDYDDWGDRISTTRCADGLAQVVSNAAANIVHDGEVWHETITTRSTSDTDIAPLVTASRTRLSGLSLATNALSVATDVRGNETVSLSALHPAALSSQSATIAPGILNVATNWYTDGVMVSNVTESGVLTRYCYDPLRRETARIDGRGNVTRTVYDGLGRVAATIDALTHVTTYAYDVMGRVAAVTNALGEVTEYAYDGRGNRIRERGATYPVDYEYDCYGNKIAMTTYRDSLENGDTTRWLYDEPSGLVTSKVYADGQGPTYTYTDDGKLAKRTWARGVETFYAYDGWGNLTDTTYSDNTPTIALRYDAMGRQIEAHDAAGVTTFAYDAYGALTNETVIGVAGTNIIERYYDTFGRNAGYALNGIRQTALGYDPATGRLVSMQTGEGRAPARPQDGAFNGFTWQYHQGSDLKSQLTYPNGLTATWTYDANNQLLQVRNATPSATVSQYDYTYNAAGRRIARSHSGTAFAQADTIDYAYNAKSELTNAVATTDANYTYSYNFDEIGNRESSSERGTNMAYVANNLNQYTSIDDFTPLFDADGNQTLVKTATGIWQVTYNGENRPILWTYGDTNIVMSYDRMGRRVTKNDQRFVYDGYLQVANLHSPTPTQNSNYFIWDPTEPVATRPLVWHNSKFLIPNSSFYYTHDGNKNVRDVIASDGAFAAHYEYAPFGAVVAQSGESAAANPWRFSSEFANDDTATTYYNYRHYEPIMGRWTSRDPIEEIGGANLFIFVANNVISQNDNIGLNFIDSASEFLRALRTVMEHLAAGATMGICVRNWFVENKDRYECCPEGTQKPVGLDKYDGVINGTKSSWTIAHRITGCQLKAIGLSEEEVALLNGFHETYEFFRPWHPEALAFMDEFNDFNSLVNQIGSSIWQYLNDTISDIEAVMEGFNSDGENCYEKYIPRECKFKTSK